MITGNELNLCELLENLKKEYDFTWEEMASHIVTHGNTYNKNISKNHLMKWRKGTIPETENIQAIATAFNLSEKFVMGLCSETKIDTGKIGNTEISKETGLNNTAINNIRKIKKLSGTHTHSDYTDTLNFILSDQGRLMHFLEWVQMYISDYDLPEYRYTIEIPNDKDEGTFIGDYLPRLLEMSAKEEISKVLYEWQSEKQKKKEVKPRVKRGSRGFGGGSPNKRKRR